MQGYPQNKYKMDQARAHQAAFAIPSTDGVLNMGSKELAKYCCFQVKAVSGEFCSTSKDQYKSWY